jgi:hypothetical protein
MKTVVRAMSEGMKCTQDAQLEHRLRTILAIDKTATAKYNTKVVKCILTIMYGIKKSWTAALISSSFDVLGQYPVDQKKILAHCKKFRTLSVADYNHTIASMDQLIAEMLIEGEIADEFMGKLQIPETVERSKIPFNKKTINRQRPILLAHMGTIRRLRAVFAAKKVQAEDKIAKHVIASTVVTAGEESARLISIAIDTKLSVAKIVEMFLAQTVMFPKPNAANVKIAIKDLLMKEKVGGAGPKIWQQREIPLLEWANGMLADFEVGEDEAGEMEIEPWGLLYKF